MFRSVLCRSYATASVARPAVKPTAAVPDVETFLKKIGRNMEQYKEHFETWDDFAGVSAAKLKDLGLETRDRRYLLQWFDRFSRGVELAEYKRGVKKWGGERNQRAQRAAHFGRLRAESS